MHLGLFHKEQIAGGDPTLQGNATAEQFQRTHAALQTWSEAEHNDDGTHSDVTADSVTVTGPDGVTVATDIKAKGDVWAQLDTGAECGIGFLPRIPGSSSLLLGGEVVRQGVLIGGATGYFLERRPGAFSPFTSGQEFVLWNLAQSPLVTPVLRIGTMSGVPTLIDGGTGANLNLGDLTEPLQNVIATVLRANSRVEIGTAGAHLMYNSSDTAIRVVGASFNPAGSGWSLGSTTLGSSDIWEELNVNVVKAWNGVRGFGRTVADGVWVNTPYNAADYAMNAGLVVAAGDVPTNRYCYIGKTLKWQVNMQTFTVGGAGGTLLVRIPNGHTAAAGFSNMGGLLVNPPGGFNWTPCIISWAAGASNINVVPQSFSWTPGGADNNYCQFEVSIPIN